jgi:hypothetical protein
MATKFGGDVVGAFALMIVLTLATALIDDATVATLVVPIILILILYLMTKVPLRVSAMALMFCAFTLENPAELPGAGRWQSPFYMVGAFLLTHLKQYTGMSWMFFSGMDLLLLSLFLIAFYRKTTGSNIDRAGRLPTPEPLLRLATLSLAGMTFVWIVGMIRGGDFSKSLWQIDRVIYLPVVFFLFQMAIRGPKDYEALARVLLVAAVIRAGIATYVMNTVTAPPDMEGSTRLPYATSHHDSMLFAAAAVLLVALALHRATPKALRLAATILPILVLGMIFNGRRMVAVQIGMVFLTLYVVTPMSPIKRKVKKVMLVMSPIFAIYVVAGWNQKGGVFKPVQTIRSVVDPKTDASSQTREIEDYDLIYTVRQYPIFGAGYGNGYWEVIPLPEMGYQLERYCPHNSLLGMWAICGIVGFTSMTLLWVAGVFFGMRAYHLSTKGSERAAALMSFGIVLIYEIQCWGDMGLGSWTGVFLMGPGLTVAGKLAVTTGAWPMKERAKRSAVVASPIGAHPAPVGAGGPRGSGLS